MPLNAQHDRFLDLLFQRAGLDGHPSPMMLSRLERAITDREDADAYVEALLDCIERQRYPSPMLLQRTAAIIRALEVADQQQAANDRQGLPPG